MIYDIESRLVRTAADQLGIPVYDNILIIKRSGLAEVSQSWLHIGLDESGFQHKRG